MPLPRIRLSQNFNLYSWGERGGYVYLIEDGWIKTVTYSSTGKHCLLDIYATGELVGELGSLVGDRRSETATAMVPTTLQRISRDQFLDILREEGMYRQLLECIAGRIVEQQETITLLVTLDAEQRLAITLLRLVRKLGRRQDGHLLLPHRITHEDFSGMVGTTRSRIGHFLKEFRSRGLVHTGPGLLAVNDSLLQEYVESFAATPEFDGCRAAGV